MSELFNPDNVVAVMIRKMCDMIILSVLWVLFSIPIITVGATTAALYYAIVKSIRRERSYPVKEFFYAFKMNFWKGTLITLVLLGFSFVFFVSDLPMLASFMLEGNIADYFFGFLFVLKLFVLFSICIYIFPVISRYDVGIIKLFESALVLSLKHFTSSVILVVIISITVYFAITDWLLLLVLPSITCLLCSYILERILVKYVDVEQEKSTSKIVRDEWYLE